ncbi:checkpoint protein HUS1 [Drosophila obscura]|uniref:checkpoint protein HUS1 n=1 Tax=Drosophila obscura TaxID=7282 RepID=UPI000BA0901A|nr:checkpoint protein HUS1 [Drosophila obscura]
MKFRALMQDPLYIREFENIVATLAKLAKDCIMILGAQQMHFIVNEDQSSTSSPLVWVSIAARDYFPEYMMEAARPDQDYIVLAMSSANLGRAMFVLRSGGVNSCKLKLQRIQFPCVSVIATLSSSSTEAREVIHDVPVTIIPASDWPTYVVPRVPASQLALGLPSLRLLRTLIDKLKNVSPSLEFQVSYDGELNVVATSEMSTVTSRFKRLLPRYLSADKEQEASCSVDSRKASAFFGALQLANEELTIGIDREHSIHLQIDVRKDVVLHSILPAVCA